MGNRKRLFFDVETTGLDSKKCAIVQIAGIIEINGEITEEFNICMKPFKDAEISEEALTVIGKTKDEIFKEQSQNDAYLQFKKICLKHVNKYDKNDKLTIVAHNISFDFNFIVEWSKKCGDKFLGSFISYKNQFCTLKTTQALKIVDIFPSTENNKLVTLCEKLNISFEGMAHDALFDIRATYKLFKALETILLRCKKQI